MLERFNPFHTLRKQGELIEAQNAFMQQLEEEVKDWQAVARQSEDKDVNWTDYVKNHKDCWEAYVENPLAKGYVDRLVDFVIKGGFQIVSEDEKTQEICDEIMKDGWDDFQVQVARELAIYGEIFDRFFTGIDEVKTRLVDPATIKAIETNPEDVQEIIRYFHEYKRITYDDEGNVKADAQNIVAQIDADEIIHIKINNVSTAKRGISDLLCNLKWLKRHKIVFTNLVRRSNIQLSLVGEKIIKGPGVSSTTIGGYKKSGDDSTSSVTGQRKERTIQPGTWYVHSPNLEYKFTPLPNDMKGMVDLLKMLNKIICAGFGLSEHWLGDTSESNLATATSLELPILAKFERRQEVLKSFFRKHFEKIFELKGIEADFDVVAPELTEKDAIQFGNAIKSLCEGLVLAVTNEWISDESAAKTLGDYLDYFDSFDDEKEKIENEIRLKKPEPNGKKNVLQMPIPEPIPPPFPEAFKEAVKDFEFTFSKTAMDELLKDYARVIVDSFKKGRDKVLATMKKKADETGR